MPFTMPNYPEYDSSSMNQISGAISGALKGAQAAPDLYTSIIKAKYAPLTAQADAMSKIAYASLMGPQYIAKLLENPAITANIKSEDQKKQLLNMITQAPVNVAQMTQGLGNPLNSQVSNILKSGQGGSPIPQMGSQSFPNSQMGGQPYPPSIQSSDPNAIQQAANNMQEGQGITNTGNKTAYGDIDLPPSQITQPSSQFDQPQQNTWSENIATQNGIQEQGKEAGNLRAKAVDDFGADIQSALLNKDAINDMGTILSDPQWSEMRKNIPFFQDKQLDYLSKTGTPEQQELIGRFTSTGNSMIKNVLNSFKGNQLKADVPIAQDMKINKNDTWNVAVGKFQSIALLNELNLQREQKAAQLTDKQHLNKYDAIQQADKMVHGDAIRGQIEGMIYPSVTINGQTYISKDGKFFLKKG